MADILSLVRFVEILCLDGTVPNVELDTEAPVFLVIAATNGIDGGFSLVNLEPTENVPQFFVGLDDDSGAPEYRLGVDQVSGEANLSDLEEADFTVVPVDAPGSGDFDGFLDAEFDRPNIPYSLD
jgi:hypothetical protein